MSLERVDLRNKWIPPILLDYVPERLARRHMLLPIDLVDGVLKIVVPDDAEIEPDKYRFIMNQDVTFAIASEKDIRDAIDRHYQIPPQ